MVAIHTCEPLNLEKVGGGGSEGLFTNKKAWKKNNYEGDSPADTGKYQKDEITKKTTNKKKHFRKAKTKKNCNPANNFWLASQITHMLDVWNIYLHLP